MQNFDELVARVKKKGFGTSQYDNVNGDEIYLSRGVREVFLEEGDISPVIRAITRFQKKDYGDAAAHGREPREGHEYGRYDIAGFPESDDADTAVWIHRAENSLVVYFAFER